MKEKDTSPNEDIACRRVVDHCLCLMLMVIIFVEERSTIKFVLSFDTFSFGLWGEDLC